MDGRPNRRNKAPFSNLCGRGLTILALLIMNYQFSLTRQLYFISDFYAFQPASDFNKDLLNSISDSDLQVLFACKRRFFFSKKRHLFKQQRIEFHILTHRKEVK